MTLSQCWEIKNCGRERGGKNVAEFGECPASQLCMGHSCWALVGTLCGGKVQGSFAEKEGNCVTCEVYRRYSRANGLDKDRLLEECHEEQVRYQDTLRSIHRQHREGGEGWFSRLFAWI